MQSFHWQQQLDSSVLRNSSATLLEGQIRDTEALLVNWERRVAEAQANVEDISRKLTATRESSTSAASAAGTSTEPVATAAQQPSLRASAVVPASTATVAITAPALPPAFIAAADVVKNRAVSTPGLAAATECATLFWCKETEIEHGIKPGDSWGTAQHVTTLKVLE
jgi:hypothetical protein